MFWVQVVVALGVVLGTVLVAGGRGDSLGELSPDRPPARLPDDRAVRAEDVNTLRIGVGLRGYRMDEVDDVLDVLADELTRRDEEIAELRGEERISASPDAEVPGDRTFDRRADEGVDEADKTDG
jgi:DivIVA domain-containing protein